MIDNNSMVQRLTALWALSEAAFGGVLHAFQVPFTGLFINASAVIFITLIAFYSQNKSALIKATLVVLIIKATVSPHTPLNAYFAVTMQGLLGLLLFRSLKYFTASAIVLGFLTMFQSALQRIIVLTIIFGKNLWESIDIFGNYLIDQITFLDINHDQLNISLWLISGYVIIHLIAGVLVGIFAAKIPGWVKIEMEDNHDFSAVISNKMQEQSKSNRKRKNRFLRPGSIAIMLLALSIIILTYVFPQFNDSQGKMAIIMIVRSIVIMFIWYAIAGPLLRKIYYRYLANKKSKYTKEVEQSVRIMPLMKVMVVNSWNASKKSPGLSKFKRFITLLIVTLFTVEIPQE